VKLTMISDAANEVAASEPAQAVTYGVVPLSAADPLANIRAALAAAAPGLPSVKIGVVDGLPDLTHPALRGAGIDVLEMMVPPGVRTPDRHATGVSSIIFGGGETMSGETVFGETVAGIAAGCSGLALPIFFGDQADRPRPASQLDLARAITFALEHDVSIINVSAGQKSWTVEPEAHLEQALQHCVEKRVLTIAAAGNDGCACFHVPAGCQSVLAVGALSASGHPLENSNWGEPYLRNGLLAPGENLLVATPGGGMSTASGTSFATAVVAGVAALLVSAARREGYSIDPIDVQRILIDSAVPCAFDDTAACQRYLAGTLDARAALQMLHRIGSAARSPPMLRPAAASQSDAVIHRPIKIFGQGEEMMSDAVLETSEITAAKVSPAGAASANEAAPDMVPTGRPTGPAARGVPFPIIQNDAVAGLSQQGCACGGGEPPQIVYALGSLWFDFGTEARHDAFVQQLGYPIQPQALFDFLSEGEGNEHKPEFLTGLTFILMQDQMPIYAVQPAGPFALLTYRKMLLALKESLKPEVGDEQRISLPGYISGSTRLMNGMTVPVVYPDPRGMWRWTSQHLIDAFKKANPNKPPTEDDLAGFANYLNRIYYEMRNLGVAPQDRAINFAATNAYQAGKAFEKAFDPGRDPRAPPMLFLQGIVPKKSPICRPDSDCWDVEITFFDPVNINKAVLYYRFTVDVSDVLPVTIGNPRWWWAPN
jgi:cyanobactin maturation PatA/PatG family protease